MGFFNKVMNTGVKAKLQGEVALMERELKQRKQRFGVELYDQLQAQDKGVAGGLIQAKPATAIPGSVKHKLKDAYEQCVADLLALDRKKDALQQEKLHKEVSRERGAPAVTASEKMAAAGSNLGSRGKEVQLSAQMALVDRDMTKRKEQFGIDVYQLATSDDVDPKHKAASGIKGVMAKGLGSISETEKRLQTLIATAKKDVESIQRRIDIRQREIEDLAEESLKLPGRGKKQPSAAGPQQV